jgi:hypothetical protein
MSDEPKTTLTDGRPVTPDHREIDALVLAQRAACDAMIAIHNIGISSADCTMRMRAERDRLYPLPTRSRTRTLSTGFTWQIVDGAWWWRNAEGILRESNLVCWSDGTIGNLPYHRTITDLRLLLEILECPEEDVP